MKKVILIALFISLCVTCLGSDLFKKSGQAVIVAGKIKDVHDGDTVTVSVTKEFKVRLLDCWASEINSKDLKEKEKGEKARDFLKKILNENEDVYVEIPLYDSIEKSFTFGRLLGYIWKDVDGDGQKDNISEIMVENKHATKSKEN